MTSCRRRGRRNSAAAVAAATRRPPLLLQCDRHRRQPANTAAGEPGRWEPIEYSRRLKTAPLPQTAVHQRGSLLLQSLPPQVGPRWAGGWKQYGDKCYDGLGRRQHGVRRPLAPGGRKSKREEEQERASHGGPTPGPSRSVTMAVCQCPIIQFHFGLAQDHCRAGG